MSLLDGIHSFYICTNPQSIDALYIDTHVPYVSSDSEDVYIVYYDSFCVFFGGIHHLENPNKMIFLVSLRYVLPEYLYSSPIHLSLINTLTIVAKIICKELELH